MSEWIEAKPGTPEARDLDWRISRMGRNDVPVPFFESFDNLIIGRELMREWLLYVWTGAEYPAQYLSRKDWLLLFRMAGFVTDCDEPPELPLEAFRGAPLDDPRGFSWSWDRGIAEFFAERHQRIFRRRCGIFSIRVERQEDLLGISHHESGRREKELIINPEILFGDLEPVLEEELGAIGAAA